MRIRTSLLLVGGIVGSSISACGGEDPVGPPPPTALRATSSTAPVQGVPGATLDPFEVQVTDHRGNPVPDVTLQADATGGRLDDPSPVTDAEGLARTTLTLPDQPASVTVTVTGPGLPEVRFHAEAVLPRPAACTEDPDSLGLAPGEVVVRDAQSDEACFFLRSGSGHRYRIGIVRSSFGEDPTDTSTVHLSVDAGAGVSAAPPAVGPAVARAPAGPGIALTEPLLEALRVEEATEALHVRLRLREAELAARMPPGALLPDRRPALRTESEGAAVSALAPTILQTVAAPSRLRLDVSTTCATPDPRPALLLAENQHLAFYQDSVQHASSPLDPGLVQSLLDYYAAFGHEVIEEYFGGVPDINGDGVVNVLATPAVPIGAAAFVWSGDFFSTEDCPSSNEMELVYFQTGTVRGMADGNWQALGTMVHEAKHVSSLYHRLRRIQGGIAPGDGLHPLYVEEGTAEIAAEVATRAGWVANGGPARTAPVRAEDFGGAFDRWNFGIALRLARTVRYLSSRPNAVVVDPAGASSGHSVYGSGWHFHRWLGDAYGGAASAPAGDAALFHDQNDSLTISGRRGIEVVTGRGFLDLLEEWSAAVLLNGTGTPAPARPYATYDFPSAGEVFCRPDPLGVYPWPLTVTGDAPPIVNGSPSTCDTEGDEVFQMAAPFGSAVYTGRIGPAGLLTHEFLSDGSGRGVDVAVSAEVPARILVVRTQ